MKKHIGYILHIGYIFSPHFKAKRKKIFSIFHQNQKNIFNFPSKSKGVHSAARKGQSIAIWEHLTLMKSQVSKMQLAKLCKIQRSRDLVRKYRMSKVNASTKMIVLVFLRPISS